MVRLYFDEDSVQHLLIAALRSRAMDVATSLDAGMNACGDESQLTFATEQGRVLVSCNASDFAELHAVWQLRGQPHSGILIIPQQRYSVGELVRRILRFAASGLDFKNGIHYVSNF